MIITSLFELYHNTGNPLFNKNIKKVKYLDELTKYFKYIDQSKYIIGSSASLVLYGLVDTNHDIDICIDDKTKQSLIDNNLVDIEKDPRGDKLSLKDSHIDLGFTGKNLFTINELKSRGFIVVNGFVFQDINSLKYFYTKLSIKRPKMDKFKLRLDLINNYLENNN